MEDCSECGKSCSPWEMMPEGNEQSEPVCVECWVGDTPNPHAGALKGIAKWSEENLDPCVPGQGCSATNCCTEQ